MAIFRCISCDQIFDISMQHSLEGLNFCDKCFLEYKEKIKPKLNVNKYEDEHEKKETTKQRKKKK